MGKGTLRDRHREHLTRLICLDRKGALASTGSMSYEGRSPLRITAFDDHFDCAGNVGFADTDSQLIVIGKILPDLRMLKQSLQIKGLERWQSGRSRRTRNAEYSQGYRGFESLPLRQTPLIAIYSAILPPITTSRRVRSTPPILRYSPIYLESGDDGFRLDRG